MFSIALFGSCNTEKTFSKQIKSIYKLNYIKLLFTNAVLLSLVISCQSDKTEIIQENEDLSSIEIKDDKLNESNKKDEITKIENSNQGQEIEEELEIDLDEDEESKSKKRSWKEKLISIGDKTLKIGSEISEISVDKANEIGSSINEKIEESNINEKFKDEYEKIQKILITQSGNLSDYAKKTYERFKEIEINGFTIEDDKNFGRKIANEIINNPKEYKLLDKENHVEIYNYLNKILDRILQSGNVKHKDEFDWKLFVIDDDQIINAQCSPGGVILIYTGILKYFDNEAELAGVLAHEIGHADNRHSTRQLTKQAGIQFMLDVIIGEDENIIKQFSTQLIGLRYSRKYEREADKSSVKYLCSTDYDAAGAVGFFKKISGENENSNLGFLSTHPNNEDRIKSFKEHKEEFNCLGSVYNAKKYKDIMSKF